MLANFKSSTETVVTAGELAEILNRFAADPAKTSERLKHWARTGLLTPIHEQHPGTGSHRRYDYDAVTVAAVWTALAEKGLSVISMEGLLSRAMGQAQAARRRWRSGQTVFFVIPTGRRKGTQLLQAMAFVHEGPFAGIEKRLRELPFPATGMDVVFLHDIFEVMSWDASRAAEYEARRGEPARREKPRGRS
jgi:hypothetical protein